jgi:hypothetical protein
MFDEEGSGGENLRKRGHLEDLIVEMRIILKGVLKKSVGRAWLGSIWLRRGTVGWLL